MGFLKDLSIRNKLGLLLGTVTIMFLISYSFVVLNNVQKDKLAYVYDSSLAYSKTVGDQIYLVMAQAGDRASFYLSQFVENKGFSSIAENMIKSENIIEGVYIIPNGESPESILDQNKLVHSKEFSQLEAKAIEYYKSNQSANTDFSLLVEPTQLTSWYIFINHKGTLNNYTLILRVAQGRLQQALAGNNLQDIYLADKSGRLIFSPPSPMHSLTPTQMQNVIAKMPFGKSSQLMSEEKIDNRAYLMAVTKLGFKDLILISPIAKAMAMESLYIIMAKSALFLILFLSLTVIISIIAPSHVTQGLLRLFNATKEIEKGNFNVVVPQTSNDEIGGLTKSFNQMTREIQRLIAETAEKARMANELETARTVQETLLPTSSLTTDKLSIHGFYESASECGGDWWHYSRQGDKTYIWIGDVTGHGAAAALVTSAAKAVSSVCQDYPGIQVDQIMAMMNKAIHQTTKGKLMMTFFLGCIDEKTNTLTYSIASHEPPIFLPSNLEEITARELPVLGENTGPRLGQKLDSTYTLNTYQLSPGDRIFFFTDGVTDLQNPEGKQFGEGTLVRTLFKMAKTEKQSEKFYESIKDILSKHRKDSPLVDDVTFVVMDVHG